MVALEVDREQLREDAKTAFQYILVVTGTLLGIGLFAFVELHKQQIPAFIHYGLNALPYLLGGVYVWYWLRDRYMVEENAGTSTKDSNYSGERQ